MGATQNKNQLGIQFYYRGYANCILAAGSAGRVYTSKKDWKRSFAESHARKFGFAGYSFFDGSCEYNPYEPQFLIK